MLPGRKVTLVLDEDLLREEVVVRNSIVYDVDGDSLFIAQTEPRLTKKDLGREIILTYVEKIGERKGRFAIKTKVEGFIEGYPLSDGRQVEAISLRVKGRPFEYNLRRFHRVQVTSRCNLRFYIGEEEFPLVDLSVGGCSFLSKRIPSFFEGERVNVSLSREDEKMELEGNVLRIVPRDSSHRGVIYQISLEFSGLPPDLRRSLTRLIYELEKLSAEFLTKD